MNLLIWVAVWLVCGFVAYGMMKSSFKRSCESTRYVGYDIDAEISCLFFLILGLCGLGGALLTALLERKFGFCLKMPTELKQGQNGRI